MAICHWAMDHLPELQAARASSPRTRRGRRPGARPRPAARGGSPRRGAPNGSSSTAPSVVPPRAGHRPSTRNVGADCGFFVLKILARYSSGRIPVRRAWTSSVASHVGRKRTRRRRVGRRAAARAASRAARRRPRRGSGAAAAVQRRRHGGGGSPPARDVGGVAGPKPPR